MFRPQDRTGPAAGRGTKPRWPTACGTAIARSTTLARTPGAPGTLLVRRRLPAHCESAHQAVVRLVLKQALAALGVEAELEAHGATLHDSQAVAQPVVAPVLGSRDAEPRGPPVAGPAALEAAPPRDQPRPPRDGREQTRILVVDDDPQTLRYVRDVLSDAGYAPLVTGDPDGLSDIIHAEKPCLVLLDLMLPGTDGIELMKRLPELADLPVIFISGYGRDETIAKALESGAADYIVKPFSPTELVARVQAALRSRAEPETFVHGDLAVDYGRRRVSVAGREVPLTATEFELLRVLSLNGGRVVTTEALLRQVWGRRGSDDTDRVRTVVKKLRHKLGDAAANPTYVFNEHGVGYRFATPGGA